MTSQQVPIARHPDLAELRARYDQVAETPLAQTTYSLTVLAGLYVALSPWIVGFAGMSTLAVNNLIIGLTVAGLGIGCASAFGRLHGAAWLIPVLGVWTIITPWVISGAVATMPVVISNVISGAVVGVLGIAGAGMMLQHR
ncbi:SPW repeat protein [Saccharopolyspora sp. NPDC002686]|uniref:SPW repeat protein n=1 Tax=Saccharopolyspora sp. NPDC002686 TaxID=3154541 RepID=UPI00332CD5CC